MTIRDMIIAKKQSGALKEFIGRINNQENIPPKYAKLINEHFWELIGKPTDEEGKELAQWFDRRMTQVALGVPEHDWKYSDKQKAQKIRLLILAKPKVNKGDKFVAHIQAHLKEGEKVICKICGKTANEIIDEVSVEVEEKLEKERQEGK